MNAYAINEVNHSFQESPIASFRSRKEDHFSKVVLLLFVQEKKVTSLKSYCFFSFKKRRSLLSPQNRCAQSNQLLIEVFIPAIDEVDVVHICGAARGKARDDEGSARA